MSNNMGRYVSGDIEHKFWFGVQSSGAASRFGGETDFNEIPYEYDSMCSFDLEEFDKLIDEFNELFQENTNRDTDPDWFWEDVKIDGQKATRVHWWWENPELKNYCEVAADLCLGLKIFHCILDTGHCYFTAEL